jgi:hypothetical protein
MPKKVTTTGNADKRYIGLNWWLKKGVLVTEAPRKSGTRSSKKTHKTLTSSSYTGKGAECYISLKLNETDEKMMAMNKFNVSNCKWDELTTRFPGFDNTKEEKELSMSLDNCHNVASESSI